jgi:hypothetical protein
MSAHTVGPWAYDDESAQVIAPKCGYQWTKGAPVIAEVTPMDYSEQSANGRLIAAAPTLLAALERLVASLSEQDEEGLIEHAPQMEEARAAISASKGQA